MFDFSSYIGIPFKSCGRDRSGLDCWGLLRLIYQEKLGIRLMSYIDEYTDAHFYEKVSDVVNAHIPEWGPVKRGSEKPFDVIILRLRGLPIHIGMVIKPGQMIHVLDKLNTCLERYNTPLWANRIRGIYRHGK